MSKPNIQSQAHYEQSIQVANMLGQKAMKAENRESLIFVILNDTIQMIHYDRALLWDLTFSKPKLLGISGESKINNHSPQVKQWTKSVENIVEPSRAQIISFTNSLDENEQGSSKKITMLWIPIAAHGKQALGLWLELWNTGKDSTPPKEMVKLLINFLVPVYGIAWEKYSKGFDVSKLNLKKWSCYLLAVSVITLAFVIKIPLRIVAPCEIVAKDSILITAPLEGIIENIAVNPGDYVNKGDELFHYDREAPLQGLEVARKQVEILISEIKRASTLGFNDPKVLKDLAILTVKLEKEKLNLELAEYYASQLDVKAPEAGVVMLDNPDEWRGNPVKIGEKVLAISDPDKSKIRMWIPEGDNVAIDPEKSVKIYLNISPETSYSASLTYIANESFISEKGVSSFISEADWRRKPKEIRFGLKGTAVLYGEKVSLLYYVIRKPWAYLRDVLGM